jgi:hypothetical protein
MEAKEKREVTEEDVRLAVAQAAREFLEEHKQEWAKRAKEILKKNVEREEKKAE